MILIFIRIVSAFYTVDALGESVKTSVCKVMLKT